ncbi:hypothetical protein LUZ61_014553 [Rhynchospora tenuis]|uniref:Uncharacterized protein n=1 Tax=Rhynchospora tenuis TaxID=198213 RepID=A0AAD5Z3A0_9POAL|nr:hypothetical protein LUZ61_014553 [Rhynchospora tenuis]
MAQIGRRGEDVVPSELMAVMPQDPNELLDLARRITSMAIESQVSQLEAEAVHLREKMSEKDRAITELKERLLELDQAFRDADGRLRSVLEDNIKLCKERDSLAQTSKRLTHDVQKLEKFKRQLIQSLREENPSFHKEAIDITTCDQFNAKVSLDGAVVKGTHDFSAMSSVPKFMSTSGLQRGSISAIGSPKLMPSSGVTSPTNRPQPEFRVAMTPWHNPSSKRSSTVGSPTHARPISGQNSCNMSRTYNNYIGVKLPWLSNVPMTCFLKLESSFNLPHYSIKTYYLSFFFSYYFFSSLSGRAHIDGKEFFRQARCIDYFYKF